MTKKKAIPPKKVLAKQKKHSGAEPKKKSTPKKALAKPSVKEASTEVFPAKVHSVRATWIYPKEDAIEFYREHVGSLVQWNGTRFACKLRSTNLNEDDSFALLVTKSGEHYDIKYDMDDGTETNFARAFIGKSEFVLCHESSTQLIYIHLSF